MSRGKKRKFHCLADKCALMDKITPPFVPIKIYIQRKEREPLLNECLDLCIKLNPSLPCERCFRASKREEW